MQLIPSIDIQFGKCVRLYQGNFDQSTVYENGPVEIAKAYGEQGVKRLHIVDLEGARLGQPVESAMIADIVKQTALQVQVGGGIRIAEHISTLLNMGVASVVIGSMAVKQSEQVKKWLVEFGADKIVLALDVRLEANQPLLVTQGWQEQSQLTLWELLDIYQGTKLQQVLCTDVSRDGVLAGPNFSLYQQCQERYPDILWQASGGISAISDLNELKAINLNSVIIGKALYEKRFTLTQAMQSIELC